jgi:hypothetical protein
VFIGENRRTLAAVEENVSPNSMLSIVYFPFCENAASTQATALCADEAGNACSVLLLICRVFFSCCGSVAWPQVAVWAPASAPRSSIYDKQLPRATASAPRSSTCEAPWASAWAPLLRTTPCPVLFRVLKIIFLDPKKDQHHASPPFPTRRDCFNKSLW